MNFSLENLRPVFWALGNSHPRDDLRVHYLTVGRGREEYRHDIAGYCNEIGLLCAFYEIGDRVKTVFSGGVEDGCALWTVAIYGRLLMADVLPAEVKCKRCTWISRHDLLRKFYEN